MAAYVPPGWPAGVHPPGSEDFERTAQAWLLDTVPSDYRLHGVLRRYPLALAAMAIHHTRACVTGAREGYRTARTELGDALPPHALEAVLAAYRAEGRRLVATAHAVDLVARALRGEVFTPQLQEAAPPGARRGPARPGVPAATVASAAAGIGPDGRRPGTGQDGGSPAQPATRRGVTDRGAGEDQLSARRTAPAPEPRPEPHATEDQLSARRKAPAPPRATEDQSGARHAAPASRSAPELVPDAAEDQLSARRKAAGTITESPGERATERSAERTAERPNRDGPAKARKASAAQRPARNGGAARRKARPTDKHAATG
jgi:hypothetical protein